MQSERLHASLHAFAVDVAATLAAAVAAGDELPFEVVEAGAAGARPGLFHYQPLTANFIEARWDGIVRLPTAAAAQTALAGIGDLREYLDTYAEQHRAAVPPAADALRCFVHRVFDGCDGDFEAAPERFEPAYRELAEATSVQESKQVVLALLRGLDCESGEIELADGALLVPLTRLEVLPPDPLWRQPHAPATVLALMPPLEGGIEGATERLCEVQTAMRLYASGIALSPLAWIRGQRAAWRALPVPGGGRPGRGVTLAAAHEDELRSFVALVARRRPVDGEPAWALRRFELGCERADPLTGLTDHLLALRALLEPEGPQSGRLSGRVAALCAQPHSRVAVTERLARAIALERTQIEGIDAVTDAEMLCREVEQHLRALLRDVVCGHLRTELVELADSLVWEQGEPEPEGELRVRRVRQPEPTLDRGEPAPREESTAFDRYGAALDRYGAALERYGAGDGDASLFDGTL
jgi:hypothetical protein